MILKPHTESQTKRPLPLRVRSLQGTEALAFLDERWDALLLRQDYPNPTLSSAWLREVAARDEGIPFVCIVEADTRLAAAGAFSIRRPARVAPHVTTWLGQNSGTFSPEILVEPDLPDAGVLLADAILRTNAAAYLRPVRVGGALTVSLRARAPWLSLWPDDEARIVPLPPPTLDSLRKEVAYNQRRAARLGASVSVMIAAEPQAVKDALERLFLLHRERWSHRPDVSSQFSASEEQRKWYRRAVAAMAGRGQARVVEVFEDGELVGSVLGLLAGRGAVPHTWSIRAGGRLKSPGRVAAVAWIEAAMEEGAEIMDLGQGGGEPGGMKERMGPTLVPMGCLAVASSRSGQTGLDVFVRLRRTLQRVRPALERSPRIPSHRF